MDMTSTQDQEERQSDVVAGSTPGPVNNVVVEESAIHGKGVFALRDLETGEWVLTIDDSHFVTDQNPLRPEFEENEHHCDYLAGGQVILMQWPERYINHCCRPNVYVKSVEGHRHVFAWRNIAAGEELTFDYCINSGGDTTWQCNCGHPECRRLVHSDFFHLPRGLQVSYLPLLDSWVVEERHEQVEALRTSIRQESECL
jgi:hypothetical protein